MYKTGNTIEAVHQTANAKTGLTVTLSVYDETGALVPLMGGTMLEMGTTGRYTKTFIPDEVGTWLVMGDDSKGGHTVNVYVVDDIDLHDITNPPMMA